MNPQAKTIFGQAFAIQDRVERERYLSEACGADAELRAEVDGLFAALEGASQFMQQPAAATLDTGGGFGRGEAPEDIGSVIGPYTLVQRLGEGGMGTVWVAEQSEPVKRRVALKVIKPGIVSHQVLRRFEAEKQALALMDHAHIAKVFDAGATATGRPYFVMELLKGVSITTYCDELQLPIRERLQLFIPVCQAVQHAHQKGIIHRDLKPSNVLVCMQDGRPVAKVIDFGIAKALNEKLTAETLQTEIGQLVGTLEYMSPEQAELSALDVDTRTDVYAMGVMLYELLTGTTPLNRKEMQSAAIFELLRIIHDEEPPKPSTRLTASKDAIAGLAARRRTEPARLAKEVRGELDWIVMKCLEKDRARRYDSASDLARDIEHFLSDRPVDASPPSRWYRASKALRRNKGAVAASLAIVLVLIIGAAVSKRQAILAREAEAAAMRERDEAEMARAFAADQEQAARAERDAKEKARADAEANALKAKAAADEADEERRIAQAVRDFLQNDLLRQADAITQANLIRGLPGDFVVQENPTIKELLDRAIAGLDSGRLDKRFPGQPVVQAEILATIGNAYRGLGEYDRAIEPLKRALELRQARGNDGNVRNIMHDLGMAYLLSGKYKEAVPLLESVLEARVKQLGRKHLATQRSVRDLALAYEAVGRLPESIALLEDQKALANVCQAILGANRFLYVD